LKEVLYKDESKSVMNEKQKELFAKWHAGNAVRRAPAAACTHVSCSESNVVKVLVSPAKGDLVARRMMRVSL
jgi:hypothetical protein